MKMPSFLLDVISEPVPPSADDLLTNPLLLGVLIFAVLTLTLWLIFKIFKKK